MSRSLRMSASLPSTVEVAGTERIFTCNTLNISYVGMFLETTEFVEVSTELNIAVLDYETAQDIVVTGIVVRHVHEPGESGVGVQVISESSEWRGLVDRLGAGTSEEVSTGQTRVLVALDRASGGKRAFYASSGWNVQFVTDLDAARKKLSDVELAVVIAEFPAADSRWRAFLADARTYRPNARRILRTSFDKDLSPTNVASEALSVLSTLSPAPQVTTSEELASDPLVHSMVESTSGLEALLAAVSASFDVDY